MSQRTKNKALDVVYHHRILSETNSYKYLGVQLDQNLNIKDHTTQTYKKVCSCLQLLKRLRPKLTTKATVTIYQSMILSLVTYCSFVTYSSELYMKKTISLHFHADQIIGNNANQSLLKSIDSTMKKRLFKHVFKILISEPFCSVFRDYFETMEMHHSVASCKTREVFNSLPDIFRAATSLDDILKIFDEF